MAAAVAAEVFKSEAIFSAIESALKEDGPALVNKVGALLVCFTSLSLEEWVQKIM